MALSAQSFLFTKTYLKSCFPEHSRNRANSCPYSETHISFSSEYCAQKKPRLLASFQGDTLNCFFHCLLTLSWISASHRHTRPFNQHNRFLITQVIGLSTGVTGCNVIASMIYTQGLHWFRFGFLHTIWLSLICMSKFCQFD